MLSLSLQFYMVTLYGNQNHPPIWICDGFIAQVWKNDHIPALAIFLYIATSCGEQLEWLNFYITTKVALLFFFGFSQHSSPYLFAMKQLTIQGPKRTVPDHVETWQFHSLLGLKKVVSQAMTFNSTVHRVISLFLTETLRERQNSPSVAGFPECQKSGTRERESSPSVTLGEELHSGKRGFSECQKGPGTR